MNNTEFTTMELANMVLAEKQNKIKAENIRNGVQVFDIVGNYMGTDYKPSQVLFTGFGVYNFNTSYYTYSGRNLDRFDAAHIDLTNVTNLDYTMYYCTGLNNLDSIANWDTSNITSMDCTFGMMNLMNNLDALANWNTGNVTYMNYVLRGLTENMQSTDGISNWDTHSVTKLENLLWYSNFCNTNAGDIFSNWDVSNIQTIGTLLGQVNAYNSGLSNVFSNWNLCNCKTCNNSLVYGSNIDHLNLSNMNVSNLNNISLCQGGANINVLDISGWDLGNVKYLNGAGSYASFIGYSSTINTIIYPENGLNLHPLSLGNMFSNANAPIDWLNNTDVTNVTSVYNMFNGEYAHIRNSENITFLGDFSHCTFKNLCASVNFDNCPNLSFEMFANKTYESCSLVGVFQNCNNIYNLKGFQNCKFKNSTITTIFYWYNDSYTSWYGANWSKVNSASFMTNWSWDNVYSNCLFGGLSSNLQDLNVISTMSFNNSSIHYIMGGGVAFYTSSWQYLGIAYNFNPNYTMVGNNLNLSQLYYCAYGNNTYLYNTGNYIINDCINTYYMFCNQWNLKNVENIRMTNVQSTQGMFLNCWNITNISGLNLSFYPKGPIAYMFANCISLTDTTIMENWIVENSSAGHACSLQSMFYRCNNLTNESIYAIANFLYNYAPYVYINASNSSQYYLNLNNGNGYSPFYGTNKQLITILNTEMQQKLTSVGYRL